MGRPTVLELEPPPGSHGAISVSEAADLLTFHGSLGRFFGFRDEEEDFIDATFFRAVEWLNVTGYDRWLRAFANDLSAGPQYGVDHMHAGFWLFYWCRSNLALRMAEQHGLDSWLWGLSNGPHARTEPWKVFDSTQRDRPRLRDYVPLAGILPFAWLRIGPSGMRDDVVRKASELLLETQAKCGGWPVHGDESSPCLLSTCVAIHGLAATKPHGWHQAVSKGAQWLLSRQEDGGHWHIEGGPTVMLTVLTLDSIALADNGPTTFASPVANIRRPSSARASRPDYSHESWSVAPLPTTLQKGLDAARRRFRPKVGIVLATKIELTAALKLLKPSTALRGVWQVPHANETYYLGAFGAFDAVLMLCSMGTQGATGSTLASDALIHTWNPKVILLAGIAFGVDKRKHKPGDVLVAQSIIPYENQRQGEKLVFRNPIPPTSDVLINRFKNVLDWDFRRPDGSVCDIHFGPILSGEKLIDNKAAKRQLMDHFPAAIGGEMEGAGLWAAATRSRKEWLVVKAVCDWAENKDKRYQPLAAASAMSLCEHVFQNAHALDGLS